MEPVRPGEKTNDAHLDGVVVEVCHDDLIVVVDSSKVGTWRNTQSNHSLLLVLMGASQYIQCLLLVVLGASQSIKCLGFTGSFPVHPASATGFNGSFPVHPVPSTGSTVS